MKNFKLVILNLLLTLFLSGTIVNAQSLSTNWFNEDPDKDKYAGISTDLTYEELLKGKPSKPVIVAVLDGGTDTEHPDLKPNLWTNPGETPGNGIDDDANGYIDDIHGWSFIGGKNGDVGEDNLEATRIYKKYKPIFEDNNPGKLTKEQKEQKKIFLAAKAKVEKETKEAAAGLALYEKMKNQLDELRTAMGTETFTAEDVRNYKTTNEEFNKLKDGVANAMQEGMSFDDLYSEIEEGYKYYNSQVKYHYNPAFDPRKIVGDNYEDYSERFYGNNNLKGPDAAHGTHVAGIIGAVRNNNLGMNGVADNVKIMVVRVVPDGDERDKDVANAIRYAAENGASVINMSFGKPFSPGKKYVDEAVKYAASKDIVIVHGAGNDGSNLDKSANYPNPVYQDKSGREKAWIEVGAISSSGNAANFSNYGKKMVDVFAPGVTIYSTMPDGKYDNMNGTSMASPVVAGLAAVLRSYFPHLRAPQVRQIIMDSAIKVPFKTQVPGGKKKVKFSSLAASGGIVNAYRAVKMASALP